MKPMKPGMKTAKATMRVGAAIAVAKARKAALAGIKRLGLAVDAALVEAGRAAKKRQSKRATTRALKTAGKLALVAGTTVATIATARALARRGR